VVFFHLGNARAQIAGPLDSGAGVPSWDHVHRLMSLASLTLDLVFSRCMRRSSTLRRSESHDLLHEAWRQMHEVGRLSQSEAPDPGMIRVTIAAIVTALDAAIAGIRARHRRRAAAAPRPIEDARPRTRDRGRLPRRGTSGLPLHGSARV
jgi:hypothetical protein